MCNNKPKRHSFCSMIRMILCFCIKKIRIHDKKTEERLQVINKKMEERFHVIIGNMETTQTQLAEIRSRMAPVRIPPKPRSACQIWNRVVEFFLSLFQLLVFGLLLAWIASPAFLNFDADGAVRFTKPWETEQRKATENPKKFEATGAIDWSKNKIISFTADCTKPAQRASLKYVNVGMAVAAYILGLIFLALVLRGLRKAARKYELLGEHGGDFRKLLAASPDRAEHQKEFMREMMRV